MKKKMYCMLYEKSLSVLSAKYYIKKSELLHSSLLLNYFFACTK